MSERIGALSRSRSWMLIGDVKLGNKDYFKWTICGDLGIVEEERGGKC